MLPLLKISWVYLYSRFKIFDSQCQGLFFAFLFCVIIVFAVILFV